MSAMTAIFAALCICTPARYPPTIGALLKTKVKVQFDRAVTERSKPFFCRFCHSNQRHFAGRFGLVTLCQLIGRQWVVGCCSFTQLPNYPFTKFYSGTVKGGNPHILLFSKSH